MKRIIYTLACLMLSVGAWAQGEVAQIGEMKYATLAEAFAAVTSSSPTTIELLSNCSGIGIIVPSERDITVNFNNYTYTVNTDVLAGSNGTKNQCFQLLKDSKVTFNNGTIVADNPAVKMIIQNYSDLTLTGMKIDATSGNNGVGYVVSNNNGNTVFGAGTTITAKSSGVAFDVYSFKNVNNYTGANVTVDGATINGKIEVDAGNDADVENLKLTLKSGTLNGELTLGSRGNEATITKTGDMTVTVPENYKWNADGTLVPKEYVAQVGDVKYETLAEAFAAVPDNTPTTIEVLSDCAGNGIKVPSNKDITVNFNEHTYTVNTGVLAGSNGTENQCFQLLKDSKVTFNNGKIVADNAAIKMIIQNYSDLTLTGMTIDATQGNNSVGYVVSNNNGNTVFGTGTTITAKDTGVAFDVYSFKNNYNYTGANVTVDGATINGKIEVDAGNNADVDNLKLTLKSGTLNGELTLGSRGNEATITKTGDMTVTAPENYKWNADGTLVPKEYVAQIGDDKYTSLAEAVAAATEGQTVTLLADVTVSNANEITVSKKLTLDLDGKTITSTVEQPIHVITNGDLTITGNGTIAGPTGEAGKALDGKAIITVEGGKLTYLNGTLTCGGEGSDGMYGVYISDGGTAIFGNESDKTGPTITSWFAAIGENNTTSPANITIYGGTYTALATPAESDWWYYFCAPIYAAASGNINISGGEFNGYYGLSSRYSNVNQNLNITGGTFKGTKSALFVDNKSGVTSTDTRDIEVSGGTFSSAVLEEYCANGFVPVTNADGTYGVYEGAYVAQVGDKKFVTLAEAVAAAAEGESVVLLENVTLTQRVEPNGNMTIDLNGKTITPTATCGNGSAFDVKGGNVIIKNGTIDGTQVTTTECDPITARSGANVTLKDLNITINSKTGACAYAFDGSKITIESGHYENQTTEVYQYNPNITAMVVNQANVATQLLEIKGGTFKGYDPAMGDDSQLSKENHTFLAPGFYTEMQADGSYALVEEYVVIDNEDFKKLVKPTTVKTATYTRTMPEGTTFGTVCVPFSLTQGDGTSAPKLYTFGSIAESTLTINEVEGSVEPGTPVIFYIEGGEAKFNTTDASVNTKDLDVSSGPLVGTYSDDNITENLSSIYFINGDKFHQAQVSLTVPAYRAYIKNTTSGAKPRVLSLFVNEPDVTAIESVSSAATATAIYDASGRKLATPQKGLNIVKLADGKTVKLLIK